MVSSAEKRLWTYRYPSVDVYFELNAFALREKAQEGFSSFRSELIHSIKQVHLAFMCRV